jgi:FixJ family two-component response regulator
MGVDESTVFIVDDDAAVCDALRLLVESAGWRAESFGSAEAFLERPRASTAACLLLDARLPGIDGCELQKRLADRRDLPIIFISGQDDLSTAICAMKAGAVDFLVKPLPGDALLIAMQRAISRSRACIGDEARLRALRDRYATLSARQRVVMALVVDGRLNKQVGFELGISEITVKAHRGNVMRKMKAASLPELVRIADRLASVPPSDAEG